MDQIEREPERLGEHPRGTFLIAGLFGLLFFIAWAVMYFVVFAGRGHTH